MNLPQYYTKVEDIPADPPFAVYKHETSRIIRTPLRLTEADAEQLRLSVGRHLVQDEVEGVVVDMRDSIEAVPEISEVLLQTAHLAAELKKEVKLGGPLNPTVSFLLEIGDLDQHVSVANLYDPEAIA